MSKLLFEGCDSEPALGPRVRYVGGRTSPLTGKEGNIINFREGRTNAFVLFDFAPQHAYWVYGRRLQYIANKEGDPS